MDSLFVFYVIVGCCGWLRDFYGQYCVVVNWFMVVLGGCGLF